MGDARERQRAMSAGQPWPADMHRCPACQSRRTAVAPAPALALSHVPTLLGVCADCRTVWEAYPAEWKHDAVEASPCDNCAFAKGSPESEDRQAWRALLTDLRNGREFKCHKGAPLIMDAEAVTIEFDEAWVRHKGRTCAGFLRAMQQWPDWLDRRFGTLGLTSEEREP